MQNRTYTHVILVALAITASATYAKEPLLLERAREAIEMDVFKQTVITNELATRTLQFYALTNYNKLLENALTLEELIEGKSQLAKEQATTAQKLAQLTREVKTDTGKLKRHENVRKNLYKTFAAAARTTKISPEEKEKLKEQYRTLTSMHRGLQTVHETQIKRLTPLIKQLEKFITNDEKTRGVSSMTSTHVVALRQEAGTVRAQISRAEAQMTFHQRMDEAFTRMLSVL